MTSRTKVGNGHLSMAIKAAHGWWARRRPLTLGAPTRPTAAKCRTPPRRLPRRSSRSASRASSCPSPCCSSSPCSSSTAACSGADPAALFLSLSPGANASIAADLRALTAGPHLEGAAGMAVHVHVHARFRAAGLRTLTREYAPLLSYRAHASLALLAADRSLFARLSTDEPADPDRRVVRPYHAHSPSGAAVAEAVFVNLGREEDLAALDRLGVSLHGRVAVTVRGGGYRGRVVARAARKGVVAVLIAGHADGGVERDTVLLGGPGGPLTPGWAAADGAERLGFDHEAVRRRFPTIPSMSVSADTAAAIVRSLGGPALPRAGRPSARSPYAASRVATG
ncbi:putative glutamate carboxypeptidase 2 [Hordeum vulgare]|nr:putative glutamate carboxypeptidase 2 [Hordeum vulgare]